LPHPSNGTLTTVRGGRTDERPLFFVHIMKTGGATFRQLATAQFGAGEVYPDASSDADLEVANWSIDRLRNLPPERRAATRLYTGHFPFVATRLLGIDVLTLTILRDPVERTLSHLRHRRHHDPGSGSKSLEGIYEDPFFFPLMVRDHQAKVFAMTREDRLESYMDVIDVDAGRLALAKENLEEVDVLGLQERFDEFLTDVEHRFGWRLEAARNRHGIPAPEEVPQSFRSRIAEDNAADMDFYDFAQRLHRQRRAAGVGP
jgi:hypothetical protein